jgi:hypothetical protein
MEERAGAVGMTPPSLVGDHLGSGLASTSDERQKSE